MENKTNKLKVLYITPSSKMSGAETGLLYILDSIEDNIEFVIVCPEGTLSEELKKRNVKVIPLKMYNFMYKKPHLYLSTVYKIWRIIKKEKPDLVHSNGVSVNQYTAIAARLARVPCVTHCHTIEFFNKKTAFHLKLCDMIIANSAYTANQLREFLPNKKMTVVHGGVDLNRFKPMDSKPVKEKWKIPSDVKVVGMIGMFLPRKGQHYFIEAAKKVREKFPKTLFVLTGSSVFTGPEYENKIKAMADEYKLNSLFTGFLDVTKIIPALDVFCMPSIDEAYGNILNEVGAMQKTMVVFNSGGMPEIIKDGINGLLVEPANIDDFAEKIIKVLEDEKLAVKLAQNARDIVLDKFDAKVYAKNLVKVYLKFV